MSNLDANLAAELLSGGVNIFGLLHRGLAVVQRARTKKWRNLRFFRIFEETLDGWSFEDDMNMIGVPLEHSLDIEKMFSV